MQPHPSSTLTASAVHSVAGTPRSPRPAPAMQVVTKGWWVLREERVSAEELLRQDNDAAK